MTNTTTITFILIVSLLFLACESDVNYKGKDFPPKMVLNSLIDCNQDSHSIKVSESVFAFSQQESKPIEDPNLNLLINGFPIEVKYNYNKDKDNYYAFDGTLKPDDVITISGNSQLHGYVEGKDIVPKPPQIISITPEWFKKEAFSYLRTKIKVKDRSNQRDYYRIVIHTKTIFRENKPDDIDWNNSEVLLDQESLFQEVTGTLGDTNTSMFTIFSDELFQDKEYTLNVYVKFDNFIDADQYVKVEIHSLSENLYKYLRSVELASNGDNFSEPVRIFSNIKGGYGILGTFTIDEKVIEV